MIKMMSLQTNVPMNVGMIKDVLKHESTREVRNDYHFTQNVNDITLAWADKHEDLISEAVTAYLLYMLRNNR